MEDKRFEIYLQELLEWNKKFNLTAVTEPDEIKIRHFEDSLSILQAIEINDQKIADIGSGAGFPGVPLKIVRPNIRLTIIEATKKKTVFLNHLIKALDLKGVEIIWGRAETIKRADFDIVLARAVAKLNKLAVYGLHLLKKGGILVAMKQDEVEKELGEAKENIKKSGGRLKEIKKVNVGGIIRSLVIIEKIR
ncbi:MAG: 16S rRNA (guanine527-N7)-methyltransferase [Candidatus Saganbacteria bacterium]|uniref:Ribosomal RNA small subunit methyltransferase G n=1 Tax=Candidatus Saganbacteria bacterium TaxID=2575572 RepID=A0A833L1H3_UNCSA|nr:MAG: 16S rRNA (guanine527-N7)-methyltransferase [Candidatus Saganbacteria bacterium]